MNRLVSNDQSGFTLIELLVVLAISAVLFGLATINLGKANQTATISSVSSNLISDIKNQQILAMIGDKGSSSTAQPQGIYIQSDYYVLFAGSVYDSTDPNNFKTETNDVNLSTTFDSSSLIFNKGDGSLKNFSPTSNTITLSENSDTKVITLNRFGAISIN